MKVFGSIIFGNILGGIFVVIWFAFIADDLLVESDDQAGLIAVACMTGFGARR
jgi:formate/nitrite transporter FocA (FNT family)